MSGTYRHLKAGRYHLEVDPGHGPAGVRRPDGRDVMVGVDGGQRSFSLGRSERVYYWWRGPRPPRGVRLVDSRAAGSRRRATMQESPPTTAVASQAG